MTRFERCFGTVGIVIALVMESLLQGAGHAYQGPERAFIYIFVGLAFGMVYLHKRSAAEAMACHALYDVLGTTVVQLPFGMNVDLQKELAHHFGTCAANASCRSEYQRLCDIPQHCAQCAALIEE